MLVNRTDPKRGVYTDEGVNISNQFYQLIGNFLDDIEATKYDTIDLQHILNEVVTLKINFLRMQGRMQGVNQETE